MTVYVSKVGRLVLISGTCVLAPLSSPAQDITIPSGTTVTTTQTISQDGDTATVEPGGTIDTTGGGGNGIDASANDQTVDNGGLIRSAGTGIRSTGLRARINNSGNIITLTIQTGIRSNGDGAVITNSGTINADSYGVRSEGNATTIINTGTVTSLDHGIRSDGDNATIINRGLINGDSQGVVVDIHGIRVGGANTMVLNEATVTGEEDGIFVAGDGAVIINRGKVIGETSGIGSQGDNVTIVNAGHVIGDDRAIGLGGINDQLQLLSGSVLEGLVRFDSINNSLVVGNGLNLALTYAGAFSSLASTSPFVHDTANNRVFVVDPTGFATAGTFLQTIAGATQSAIAGAVNQPANGATSGSFAFGSNGGSETSTASPTQGWFDVFGGFQQQDGSGGVTRADQSYGGLVSGAHADFNRRLYGAFGGGSFSRFETSSNQQTIDVTAAYGGLYTSAPVSDGLLTIGLTAGYAHHRSNRQVANNMVTGGLETARATYGGAFVSPSVTLRHPLNADTHLDLSGRYAALFLDGYSETGSTAALTVAGRTVQVAALQAKVTRRALQRARDNGTMSLDIWAGADGLFTVGSSQVNTLIAGLPLGFAADFNDANLVGFAGIGLSHQPINGAWTLDVSLEGRLGSRSYREIRAEARAGVAF